MAYSLMVEHSLGIDVKHQNQGDGCRFKSDYAI